MLTPPSPSVHVMAAIVLEGEDDASVIDPAQAALPGIAADGSGLPA